MLYNKLTKLALGVAAASLFIGLAKAEDQVTTTPGNSQPVEHSKEMLKQDQKNIHEARKAVKEKRKEVRRAKAIHRQHRREVRREREHD